MVAVEFTIVPALDGAAVLHALMAVPGGAVAVVRVPHEGPPDGSTRCLCGIGPGLAAALAPAAGNKVVVHLQEGASPEALVGVVADHRQAAFATADAATQAVGRSMLARPVTLQTDIRKERR